MPLLAGQLGSVSESPCNLLQGPYGDFYRVDCDTVAALSRYMIHENKTNMTKADLALFEDFVKYEDLVIAARDDLIAMDALLCEMVNGGLSCVEIQGANYGIY
jgi:hypothetical protein